MKAILSMDEGDSLLGPHRSLWDRFSSIQNYFIGMQEVSNWIGCFSNWGV